MTYEKQHFSPAMLAFAAHNNGQFKMLRDEAQRWRLRAEAAENDRDTANARAGKLAAERDAAAERADRAQAEVKRLRAELDRLKKGGTK